MKKQLSSTLLAISVFGLNILPATATTNIESQTAMNNGEWCVEIPWMGIFCWEL